MKLKKNLPLVILVGMMILAFACDKGDFPFPPNQNLPHVMLIHASPDAPAVDVYLDDVLFAKSLEYPNNTRYTTLREGENSVKLTIAETNDVVLETSLDLAAETYYSVFACDVAAKIDAWVVQDQFLDPTLDSAQLRFVHLSPDAPAVDVAAKDGTVLFSGVSFKENTPFLSLPLGQYTFQIRLAGTATVLFEIEDLVLAPSVIYTIWAKGLVQGDGAQALGAEIIMNRIKL